MATTDISATPTERVQFREQLETYFADRSLAPLFLVGDSLTLLREFPSESIDFCMTSPPYWGHREYKGQGIGLEPEYRGYIKNLSAICGEIHRVLKQTGSFWLNLGDTYENKQLLGIPWRVAFTLTEQQGWILRNSVIWHKVKGAPDQARDKLRNVHENIFHFVKTRSYYYDADAIRSNPKQAKVVNGSIISATGVSGVRYKRQIELSTALSPEEKTAAFAALEHILQEIREGKLADFRMIIKGQQRATHSDSEQVSGRAKELQQRGFYFMKYHPNGSKPSDVWDIIPEDTQNRNEHFAPYPEDLCRIPILASCPPNGVVLDPFCGTGTTLKVAKQLERRGVGIDTSHEYIESARQRCNFLL